MSVGIRLRLFGRLLRHVPGGTVAGSGPDRIRAMQQRRIPDTPLTRLITGRVAPGVEITERRIPAPTGVRRIRLYHPPPGPELPGIVIHFHGGGWVLHDLEVGDWLCSHVAKGAGVIVAVVDYRLAPQHPFPAAVDDARTTLAWVARNAVELGGDGDRLAVMGESAGANLAAVTAIAARDDDGPRLRSQVLLYPPVDLTRGSALSAGRPDALILTPLGADTFRGLYLADADPADPRASPLFAATHAGLPPALIQVGSEDPLLDDASRYADTLRSAGVPVRGTVYLDAVHGFLSMSGLVPCARQAVWEIVNELRLRFA